MHGKLKDTYTVEDMLGKDVYDAAGEFVGVTNNLYLDKKKMRVLGIAIDKGFIARGLIIGTAYIRQITPHAVFLTSRPAHRLRGMTVFDINGKIVGTVKSVELVEDTNDVNALHVRRWLGKQRIIPSEAIASMGDNIFLSVEKSEL